MKLLRIIIIACSFSPLLTHTMALKWVIVTSENDNPGGTNPANPQTLRDAIEAVNGLAGTDAPNAIAFAPNVQTITLQANLPPVEPISNFALIDGLAIANLNTPQNTIEGDCNLLPSPVDNPQGFSESIRVTIDGSAIPDSIDPSIRYGIAVGLMGSITVRGLRVQTITAPGNGSSAQGIVISGVEKVIECCEVTTIQNTAYTTNNLGNRAVGIDCNGGIGYSGLASKSQCGSATNSIAKCYIHTVEGGSIAQCDGTIEALQSGNAYGILNCRCIEECRIENVTSGSINASCSNTLRAVVGRSAGIANSIDEPGSAPRWLCPETVTQKAGVAVCPIDCDQECQDTPICIRDNVICTINGGSIITSQPEVLVSETAGMLLGSRFSDPAGDVVTVNTLIQNNLVACVRSGTVTTSGDNAISIVLGAFGILVNDQNTSSIIITCNTVDTVQTGSTTLTGEQAAAFPGNTIGIWNQKEQSVGSLLQCNLIKNICGATAFAQGTCSIVSDDIDIVCQAVEETKHTPGGNNCAPNPLPTVVGIRANLTSEDPTEFIVNNNTIQTLHGGKRFAQGADSIITAIGSAGIYIDTGKPVSSTVSAHQNTITSVGGAELSAQPGSSGVIKTQGTSGLCIIAPIVTATENQITLICEGPIRAAQNSFGANITQVFFGALAKALQRANKHLEEENARPYAPVITTGIVVASPVDIPELHRSCIGQAQGPICVADNTINTVIGSAVTGGILPIGSIAAGIWLQPVFREFALLHIDTLPTRSFATCAAARQENRTSGTASNNQIDAITAGTCAPAYGIFLDGSSQFFDPGTLEFRTSTLFTLDQNTMRNICGDKILPLFEALVSAIAGQCRDIIGTLDFTGIFFPFLPFEPTSGIYTLFGGCSTISNNTIETVKALRSEARGITTAASSDMLIVENICSDIKGYGIFVGGALATIDQVEGLGSEGLETYASVRNKIHTNSTFNNTKQGIKLGLIDWSDALFGIEVLDVCPMRSVSNHDTVPEDSIAIFGNHGQQEPLITNVICNSNGTITIEIDLNNTHPLTNFIVQFFRNSTNTVLHGEQAISDFNDPLFVFTTDFNGRAQKRFTFVPLAEIQTGDNITAHVTVSNYGQAAITDTYFCDTSPFGGQASAVPCPPTILGNRPQSKPVLKPGFATLLNR